MASRRGLRFGYRSLLPIPGVREARGTVKLSSPVQWVLVAGRFACHRQVGLALRKCSASGSLILADKDTVRGAVAGALQPLTGPLGEIGCESAGAVRGLLVGDFHPLELRLQLASSAFFGWRGRTDPNKPEISGFRRVRFRRRAAPASSLRAPHA